MTRKFDSALTRRLFLKAASASALAAAAPGDAPPIYLADMSKCLPASALTHKPQRGRWRLLPYETETFSGSMLVAGRNTGAPEIRYPLPQKGWHRVSLGLRSYQGGESATLVEVRLGRDSNSVMVRHTHGEEDRIDDYNWRTVELTGSDELVFRQWRRRLVPDDAGSVGNSCSAVWLAYIKLEPLDQAAAARLREERRSGRTRVLFCHNDAWSYTYRYRPTSEAEIRREIEPFRDTDFSRIYWEAGMGDRMYYPTKIGRITAADDWIDDPYRIGDRLAKETWRTWREKGIDPLKVAAGHAHAIGLEFHATYRPSGFHFPVPQDEWNEGGAYDRRPEWRGRDKMGRPTPRLSYAFQGVRDLVAGFIKEISGYDIDGVCMAYNRRPPYLEYEQPLLDGFRKTHGKDARAVGDRDRDWLKYRATFMTKFMKQVREIMETARREKRPDQAAGGVGDRSEQRAGELLLRTGSRRVGETGPGRHDHALLVSSGNQQLQGLLDRPGGGGVLLSDHRGQLVQAGSEPDAAPVEPRSVSRACPCLVRGGVRTLLLLGHECP